MECRTAKPVDEFKGMNPRDVLPLIEGEPYISTVPVEPGLTNWKIDRGSSRIAGLNAEHALNRAVFYVSRLVSSQKERNFENTNYNDIRRVYSIWVCMNMDENSLCHIHLVKDDLIGYHEWKGNLDLLNIIMIGLSKELPDHNEKYDLHRLLGTLFSLELTQDERLELLNKEYNIPIEYQCF